ncbi:MAG: hypothetical protein LBL32_00355 [Holosporales bacterium]|jgi:hypothetical protein|nr:hypothetical protein [Holosporales bacterium]
MCILKIFFAVIGLACWFNTGILLAARSEDRIEIAAQLEVFRSDFTEFNYGIQIVDNIYNTATDGKIPFDISRGKYETTRIILSAGEILLSGLRGLSEKLAIFYPEQSRFGYGLLALRIGGALLHGIGQSLKKSSDNYLYKILQDTNGNPMLTVPDFPALTTKGEALTQLLNLTEKIRNSVNHYTLNQTDQNMLDRLNTLNQALFGSTPIKKIATCGGKCLAFILGSIAGISIAQTGQDSPLSYHITLASGIADPSIEVLLDAIKGKDIVRTYLQACEIIHLCTCLNRCHEGEV